MVLQLVNDEARILNPSLTPKAMFLTLCHTGSIHMLLSSTPALPNGISRDDGHVLCAVHCGSHEPQVASEPLKCG